MPEGLHFTFRCARGVEWTRYAGLTIVKDSPVRRVRYTYTCTNWIIYLGTYTAINYCVPGRIVILREGDSGGSAYIIRKSSETSLKRNITMLFAVRIRRIFASYSKASSASVVLSGRPLLASFTPLFRFHQGMKSIFASS